MHFHSSSSLLLLAPLVLSTPIENTVALYPSSITCGPSSNDQVQGLPRISAPDYDDLPKAANRLGGKGGTCTTPPEAGKCIRVACDNTTGIWMCNAREHAGPFSAACTDVAAFVYRGEGDGRAAKTLNSQCRKVGQYSAELVSGMAWDASGNWNVITGYANCRKPSANAPEEQ